MEKMPSIYVQPHRRDDLCLVAPSRDIRQRLLDRYHQLRRDLEESPELALLRLILRPLEKRRAGLNDGLIRPGRTFQPGMSLAAQVRERAPLRGEIRTIVVLVDFPDQQFTPQQTKDHFAKLWFEKGTNSVHDFYNDASHGLVSVQGEVVGPFRMPHPISYYANRQSGLGSSLPNARTMARDAAVLANETVDFKQYDNDSDGFVESFVIIHAGPGAERTGRNSDIWSHKWVLANGALDADGVELFAYLTIPGDCKLGVCAHELGHLAFGWPDLYDADYSSSGIGDWCLMAAGSYNGNENNPAEPSAWCKLTQGWVDPVTPDHDELVQLADVKDQHQVIKVWKGGQFGTEYFLIENRQKKGRDADLPGAGLLLWHIDESKEDNTSEKTNYKVALMQSDGLNDLEHGKDQGDDGDPFPGVKSIRVIDSKSNPSTKAYNGASTGIAINDISNSMDVMTFSINFEDKGEIPAA